MSQPQAPHHKLLIKANLSFRSKYKKYMNDGEIPRGVVVSITYNVTNMGSSDFPGGKVTYLENEFTSVPGGLAIFLNENQEVPVIKPNQEIPVYTWHTTMLHEGAVWTKIDIKAKDNAPIDFYQSRLGISKETWKNVLNVRSTEQIEIIDLLHEIKQLLSEREKKT